MFQNFNLYIENAVGKMALPLFLKLMGGNNVMNTCSFNAFAVRKAAHTDKRWASFELLLLSLADVESWNHLSWKGLLKVPISQYLC